MMPTPSPSLPATTAAIFALDSPPLRRRTPSSHPAFTAAELLGQSAISPPLLLSQPICDPTDGRLLGPLLPRGADRTSQDPGGGREHRRWQNIERDTRKAGMQTYRSGEYVEHDKRIGHFRRLDFGGCL